MAKLAKAARVGIVDDHFVLREGLINVLSKSGVFDVVFDVSTATEVVAATEKHQPQLVLIDVGIEGGGLQALRAIKEENPDVYCVMFTSCDDPLKALGALSQGAEGYILKGINPTDLVQALQGILANQSFVSPEFASKLVEAAVKKTERPKPVSNLTHREDQVMKKVKNGLTNRQVAESLKLSEQTVKYYVSSAMQKLGVHNRVSAVQAYQQHMLED